MLLHFKPWKNGTTAHLTTVENGKSYTAGGSHHWTSNNIIIRGTMKHYRGDGKRSPEVLNLNVRVEVEVTNRAVPQKPGVRRAEACSLA
jgi:hypothetical protein